jgi:AcrR family transcriptional regulator
MASPTTTTRSTARKLSTAEDRREAVLRAAARVFAERGIYGTPTAAVAKEAGISQAYLFRLFPTKNELATALVERSHERILRKFAEAAAKAKASGQDVFEAMGDAYVELLQDRELLLLFLHSHAAAPSIPAVREATRDGFRRIVELVQRETGASPEDVQGFLAKGMLLNVLSAIDAPSIDEPWARLMMGEDC